MTAAQTKSVAQLEKEFGKLAVIKSNFNYVRAGNDNCYFEILDDGTVYNCCDNHKPFTLKATE